ncbi:MAG TPA: lysylphosphatidylglycerol synthase domain-containing protein [Streptosporangiaceae bacterium]|jgi:glycosyltransferase 2 family protein|nr:lysylphosphatidylglycerol synthase domain-containing protein [Streptosporangiaceae bacterium]
MTDYAHSDAAVAPAPAGTGAVGVTQRAGARRRGLWSVAKRIFVARSVRWAFAITAAALCGLEVARQWGRVVPVLSSIGPWSAAGAMLSVLIAMFASMQVWRLLLAGLGSPLSVTSVARVVFVGQLGKYVPGSVWPVLAQMELSSAHGVPRHRSATASMLCPLITISCGLLAALLTLPFVAGSRSYLWALAAAPVLLACLCPKVLNSGMARLLRLTRRPPLERPLGRRTIAACVAWSVGSWVCYGMQVWLLADRLGAHGDAAVLRAFGGFALAWSAGFLAVFVPAGAGVREVVLVAVLAPVTGAVGAIAVALASRMLTTAGDLLAAAAAAGYSWRRSSRCRATPEAT